MSSPRYDLSSSLAVAIELLQHGGAIGGVSLAGLLGYGGTQNGAYQSRIGSAKAFGLIEGGLRQLQVTDLARTILEPGFEDEAEAALVTAFLNVPLYAAVFSEMEGKRLPPKIGLQNMLKNRFGVLPGSASMAAARLRDSAEQAGLFRLNPDRMIRPTRGMVDRQPSSSNASEDTSSVDVGRSRNVESKFPKLLEGALEQLPDSRTWDEDGLQTWLELAELSLRTIYGLPRKRGGSAS